MDSEVWRRFSDDLRLYVRGEPVYETKIDQRMDAEIFISTLDDQESIKYYKKKPSEVLFQQNNDPKHKSKKAQKWLQGNALEIVVWPPQSAYVLVPVKSMETHDHVYLIVGSVTPFSTINTCSYAS